MFVKIFYGNDIVCSYTIKKSLGKKSVNRKILRLSVLLESGVYQTLQHRFFISHDEGNTKQKDSATDTGQKGPVDSK